MNRFELLHGDCLEKIKGLGDNSVDAVVTDPPYELGFMGKKWDASGIAYDVGLWREVLRVLKPGGHLLAFGATRTYHRMAVAIEDAGFEIRDSIHWMYGCLSEDTEILVNGEWCHYSKAIEGSLALCYDVEHDFYSWQPIEQQFLYPYDDTAYRLIGERTDQLVSRNHRCLVQRNGRWQFVVAEEMARQQEARVPVLEALPDLLKALRMSRSSASGTQETVRGVLNTEEKSPQEEARRDAGGGSLCRVRDADKEAARVVKACEASLLLVSLQREGSCAGAGEALAQGAGGLDGRQLQVLPHENVGREESSVERRGDVQAEQGQLHWTEVCSMPTGFSAYGSQGRVCDGAPTCGGDGVGALLGADRGGTSCGSRHAEQQPVEPNAVCDQQGPQAVRGERFTVSDLVRVEPVHLTGKVWCVKVPTGAFIVRRNGKVFVTGNSGFPKSLDVSKAIDKAAGAERKVVGRSARHVSGKPEQRTEGLAGSNTFAETVGMGAFITAPAPDDAKQWQGWNVNLKPSHEPIIVARKPLDGTVAANVLAHGTGALNIDGCRVNRSSEDVSGWSISGSKESENSSMAGKNYTRSPKPDNLAGRWPSNVIFTHLPACEAETCAEGCAVAELDAQSGFSKTPAKVTRGAGGQHGKLSPIGYQRDVPCHGDAGGASRFFPAFRYQAKASRRERDAGLRDAKAGSLRMRTDSHAERNGQTTSPRANTHPTVKPVDLMRWLVRLVTPPGGVVLDPFTGSGTTGVACLLEGFRFIGCEREDEYLAIANARLEHAMRSETLKQFGLFDL